MAKTMKFREEIENLLYATKGSPHQPLYPVRHLLGHLPSG